MEGSRGEAWGDGLGEDSDMVAAAQCWGGEGGSWQRGSQVNNAREKGRVKDGNMTYGNKQAEAERIRKGDKEKQM